MGSLSVGGCALPQVFPTTQEQRLTLRPGELEAHGVAFITPSTVTGQEEEKQAVALIVAQVIQTERSRIKFVSLAEALNAINKSGLSDDYKRMYDEYRDTGLFKRDMLKRIGELTGARYAAQLKLQGFTQGAKERFGAFGFRLVVLQIIEHCIELRASRSEGFEKMLILFGMVQALGEVVDVIEDGGEQIEIRLRMLGRYILQRVPRSGRKSCAGTTA